MKAIILAAGSSSRLLPRTETLPKCLLELHTHRILDLQLDNLNACGISEVTIVVGHMGDKIRKAAGNRVEYAEFPNHSAFNNLYTLYSCRHLLEDDCIILFADVVTTPGALVKLAGMEDDFALFVDTTRVLDGTMRITTGENGILDLGSHIPSHQGDGNFVGIAKYSARGASLLKTEIATMVDEGGHEQNYYVQALPRLARRGERIAPVEIEAPWLEIDDEADFQAALNQDFYLRPQDQQN